MISIPENWPEWGFDLVDRPVVIRQLDSGQTNNSFLLESGGRRLVLRLNAKNSTALGIDRSVEEKILAATSEAGLSPRQYYCNPQQGILVTDYLPPWRPGPLESMHLEQFAGLLRQIHELEADVPAVNYVAYTEQYVAQLQQKRGSLSKVQIELRDRELPFVTAFQSQLDSPSHAGPRLCHHDPTPEHWRQQNRQLCLIDWEYAALRDPACDLVLFAQGWRLSCEQEQQLLRYYGSGVSRQRFGEAKRVCEYVDRLWFEIQAG